MASAPTLHPLASDPNTGHAPSDALPMDKAASMVDHALVSRASTETLDPVREQRFQSGSPICRLPVELNVVIPVRNFRVRNLLVLEPTQVIETSWNHDEDLPLASGAVHLAWAEFEVVDTRLAVRVTRLA